MYSLTFENPVFISAVDGFISIELNIDLMNVSYLLMFIKTNIQKDNSPKTCFFVLYYPQNFNRNLDFLFVNYAILVSWFLNDQKKFLIPRNMIFKIN